LILYAKTTNGGESQRTNSRQRLPLSYKDFTILLIVLLQKQQQSRKACNEDSKKPLGFPHEIWIDLQHRKEFKRK
jgi:hypothetical protein